MSEPQRTFGCLGCAWSAAMFGMSAVLVGLLFWMQPNWFVQLLWWKPPPPPPEIVLLPQSLLPPPEPPEPPPSLEAQAQRWDEMTVQEQYVDSQGATLTTIEGSRFDLPPGSVGSDQPIEAVPVLYLPDPMRVGNVGPVGVVHDLRIGGQDHWQFASPIRITMPFEPNNLPEGMASTQATLVTWVEDRWQAIPSTFDSANRRLHGETDHASLIGVGLIGVFLTGARFSHPVQAIETWFGHKTDAVYNTESFSIHYFSTGNHKPLDDTSYLSRSTFNGKNAPPHPRYITDLGAMLEEVRPWLPQAHLKVAKPWFDPWAVFVVPLANFGSSRVGGPLLIDNDMEIGEGASPHLEWDMRRTALHELIHVAQDAYFRSFANEHQRWWLEVSAEYLSLWLLDRNGYKDPDPLFYIEDVPQLPKTALDKSKDLQPYAYSRFLSWMQQRSVNVPAVIRQVNSAGPSLTAIDSALSSQPGGSLADHFASFAREFYHPNLWRSHMTPEATTRAILTDPSSEFTELTITERRRRKPIGLRTYAQKTLSIQPLSAPLLPFHAIALPPRRQARLVVDMATSASDVWAWTSEYTGSAPYAGDPAPFLTHRVAPRATVVSANRVAAPAEPGKPDVNRMSTILINRATSGDPAQVLVQRWLLMAPEWIKTKILPDSSYSIWWHPAELKEEGGGIAFRGYRLFRGQVGTAAEDMIPLELGLLHDETHIDRPPKDRPWDYSVSVVDTLGNESGRTPVFTGPDPFIGTWSGTFRVVRPKLAPIAVRMMRSEMAKGGADPGSTPGAQQAITAFSGLANAIDLVLKMGVGMTWEIEFENGEYVARAKRIYGRPADDTKPLRLRRVGLTSLVPAAPPRAESVPVALEFSTDGKLHQDFRGMTIDPDLGRIDYYLQIRMKRED